jgi:subfamily B ATP-binding cassette protein MsbA
MAFVLFGAHRVESGELSAGQLSIVLIAIIACMDPVRKLSKVNVEIQVSLASAQRIFAFIDREPEIVDAPGAVALQPIEESLQFEQVRFGYTDETEVLRGIDLTVRKGEMVALVGFSGAGKSTLVKLVPRFYDVTGGSILIDGVDIRTGTLASLREQVGIVTQDTILFSESIRANITCGREEYTEDEVVRASKAAHAHEFISQLPAGYDTVLGEGGVGLSGGQRQRLAIARAFLKDPSILILDEATSSLDSESEKLIQEALAHFVVGRTTLVIAHRLSTVQQADRIVVLEDGQVREEGTHAALLAESGLYKRLYETQFGAEVSAK